MRTLRARLTVWYGVALTATVFVFAGILYLVQRAENFAELDERVRLESNLLAAILGESFQARGPLVEPDPLTGRPSLTPDVAKLLEVVPDYMVVLGPGDTLLHLSPDALVLPYGSLIQLIDRARPARESPGFGTADLGRPYGPIRYYARPITSAGTAVEVVLAGAPSSGVVVGPRRLLAAMLSVAPFILAVSVLIGFLLAGRTLNPVNQIADEVEAITDGRSLHRRLAVAAASKDELARLTVNVNAMMARLEKSFRTLRRFTADASHELKTPLTVMRSGIERAITHPNAAPETLEILEELLVETKRMTEMVDSLLMLARADEGRAPLHLEVIDLRSLLYEIAETANILSEQSGVPVDVTVPEAPVVIAVDPTRIRQLLMNLLTNAIKYTPTGGHVAIATAIRLSPPPVRGSEVVLTVQDTGIGIAPGDLTHVFELGDQSDVLQRARDRIRDRAAQAQARVELATKDVDAKLRDIRRATAQIGVEEQLKEYKRQLGLVPEEPVEKTMQPARQTEQQ